MQVKLTNASPFLPEIVEFFKFNLGMSLLKNPSDQFVFFGWQIPTDKGDVAVKILVAKSLEDMPIAFLEGAQRFHPLPHVFANGNVCYIDRSVFVFNQFDPVNQIKLCINVLKEVVQGIFAGKYRSDMEKEFSSYWCHYWNPENDELLAFVDIEETPGSRTLFCFQSKINKRRLFFTDEEKKLLKKSSSKLTRVGDAFLLTTKNNLKATKPWPPSKGSLLIQWFRSIDPRLKKKFEQLARPKYQDRNKLFVLKGPQGYFAFLIHFKQAEKRSSKPLERLYDADVFLMTTNRIDITHVCSRNIPSMQNLKDKKIALIGCGSIGGFLAEFLIKSGAGTGSGVLTLVDNDKFEAGNIGRHYLGYPSIDKSKVKELQKELQRMMPVNAIEVLEKDAQKLTLEDLNQYDLVIDATGEESIGNHLCSVLREKSLLSVWIEGNGVAVRGLLRTNQQQACYHCIRQYEMENQLLAVKNNKLLLQGGCRSQYVTYSISVAAQAACLAADMTLDWVNGKYEPSLRTRLIDFENELGSSDCTPLPHHNCGMCNQKF